MASLADGTAIYAIDAIPFSSLMLPVGHGASTARTRRFMWITDGYVWPAETGA
ncbi:hypothetical protein SNK03_004383 [Fusarium graminearum]